MSTKFFDEKEITAGEAYVFVMESGNACVLIVDKVGETGIHGFISEEMQFAIYSKGNGDQVKGFFTLDNYNSISGNPKIQISFNNKCLVKTKRQVSIRKDFIVIVEDPEHKAINRFVEDLQSVTPEEFSKAFPQITLVE